MRVYWFSALHLNPSTAHVADHRDSLRLHNALHVTRDLSESVHRGSQSTAQSSFSCEGDNNPTAVEKHEFVHYFRSSRVTLLKILNRASRRSPSETQLKREKPFRCAFWCSSVGRDSQPVWKEFCSFSYRIGRSFVKCSKYRWVTSPKSRFVLFSIEPETCKSDLESDCGRSNKFVSKRKLFCPPSLRHWIGINQWMANTPNHSISILLWTQPKRNDGALRRKKPLKANTAVTHRSDDTQDFQFHHDERKNLEEFQFHWKPRRIHRTRLKGISDKALRQVLAVN